MTPENSTATAFVEITGITRNELGALRGGSPTYDDWQRVLSVTVAARAEAASRIAVAGRYSIVDDAVRFTPMFPFDPGRPYYVEFDRGAITGTTSGVRTSATVALPAPAAAPPTFVTHVFPTGTREPLSVVFPEPLDHGLLMRAIGVRRDGEAVVGEVRVEEREARWTMTPAGTWRPGRYELIALSILEDLAGNRIDRAFEVVSFDRTGANPEREVTSIPFVVPATR